MKGIRILAILLILFVAKSLSANVTFKVQPPTTVLEGDQFQITFTLTDAKNVESFTPPQIKGCDYMSKSQFQSSSFQSINGVTSSNVRIDFICVYRANSIGEYMIPSATVIANGKKYQSSPSKIIIQKNTNKPNQRILNQISPKTEGGKISNVIKIQLSKNAIYENEPIECTINYIAKKGTKFKNPIVMPEFDGCMSEKVDLPQLSSNQIEENTAIPIAKYILTPHKIGKIKIQSGEYNVIVAKEEIIDIAGSKFIRTQPVSMICSDSVVINVLPLPKPQPANFSGAVGQFSIETKLAESNIRTNEPATFKCIINGQGNIKYISEPKFEFPSDFELYTPKSESKVEVFDGTMKGSIAYDYTFVPQSIGKFQIPEYEFVYFDPNKQEYITLKTTSTTIDVKKGVSTKHNIEQQINTDINDIKLGLKDLTHTPTILVNTIWYWLLYLGLIVVFLCFIIQYNKRKKINTDVTGLKLAKANKVAKTRLKLAHQYMSNSKDKEFYTEIVNALWGYLSDKLSIPTSQLIRENISTELQNYGADAHITNEVIEILDYCDMAIYASHACDITLQELYNKTVDIINKIESIKRK